LNNSLGIKLKKIISIDSNTYSLKLLFNNSETIKVSLSHIFSRPKNLATEIVKGNMFKDCFIENGALAWPNGLELCADSLYQSSLVK